MILSSFFPGVHLPCVTWLEVDSMAVVRDDFRGEFEEIRAMRSCTPVYVVFKKTLTLLSCLLIYNKIAVAQF